MEKRTGKNDLVLIAALLFAALLIFVMAKKPFPSGNGTEQTIVITVDGEEVIREPASEKEYRIEVPEGGYNVIRVTLEETGEYGIVCTDADCPEHLCMEQGIITLPDEPIVCLPHRMTAKMISK